MEYLIALIFAIVCIILYDIKCFKRGYKYMYSLICIYCILISGLSYRLGLDIVNFYMDEFTRSPDISNVTTAYLFEVKGRQPGWQLFVSICKSIIPSFHFMKFVIATILNISIFYAIYKNTKRIFTGCVLYLLFLYFYFNFEILRESLAISIFLFSYEYFKNGQWRKYYLLLFLAFCFHESSVFLTLLPLVKKISINRTTIYIYICFAVFIMLFSNLFTWIPEAISSIPIFAYKAEHYMNNAYFGGMKEFSISKIFSYTMSLYLPMYMIYVFKKSNINIKYEPLIITYIFISIFMTFFPIMQRLLNYMSIFYYIFYIELIRLVISKCVGKNTKVLQNSVCILYVLYTFSNGYIKPSERFLGYPQIIVYYPYASIIDKDTDYTREIFYNLFFKRNI